MYLPSIIAELASFEDNDVDDHVQEIDPRHLRTKIPALRGLVTLPGAWRNDEMEWQMRFVIAMSCVFMLVGVATYFYQEHQVAIEAEKAREELKMSTECPETLPGGKMENNKTLNQACRAQGYID